jgi:hypothetical protein
MKIAINTFLFISLMVFGMGKGFSQTEVTLMLSDPCATTNVKNIIQKPSFDLSVYPNPAKDNIVLDLAASDRIGEVDVQIINIQGAVLYRERLYSGNQTLIKPIQIGFLPQGIYIINTIRAGVLVSKKFIVN